MERSNTCIDIMVCIPDYIACIHFSPSYEATTVIDIPCFLFWLKLHSFFWIIAFFHWYAVWRHDLVGRSGQMPQTGKFWLKKAGGGPFLVFAHSRFTPEKCFPLCTLQNEESTCAVQGNKYKKLENLRWVGRGKNW